MLRALGAEVFAADLRPEHLHAAAAAVPADHLALDFRQFVDRVDAVDVVTPAPDHFAICRQALEAGKDVFVEKPLALTLKEGRELVERIRVSGDRLQVGHVFRFHPVYARLKAALTTGRIGEVRYVAGRFAGLKRPRLDGGVTHSDAIHFFDLADDLLGVPRAVTAVLRDFLGRGLDDFSVATIEYDRALAVVESGYFTPDPRRQLEVVGERGACVADFAGWTLAVHASHHRRTDGRWQVETRPSELEQVPREEPLRRELQDFLQGIGTRLPPAVGVEAGYTALALAWAVHASSASGRRVTLTEVEE